MTTTTTTPPGSSETLRLRSRETRKKNSTPPTRTKTSNRRPPSADPWGDLLRRPAQRPMPPPKTRWRLGGHLKSRLICRLDSRTERRPTAHRSDDNAFDRKRAPHRTHTPAFAQVVVAQDGVVDKSSGSLLGTRMTETTLGDGTAARNPLSFFRRWREKKTMHRNEPNRNAPAAAHT